MRLPLIVALVLGLNAVLAHASDWPMYRHDVARSGVTDESPALPLTQQWVYRSPVAPVPAWPAPQINVERPKVNFDNALHTIAVGNTVYFSSSVDNQVYALDADTGHVRWRFFTDAPVRLAPTFAERNLYFGSDDGRAYCIGAKTGQLIWQYDAARQPTRIVGNSRITSLWPVRTDLLVEGDRVYFGSGIIPHESPALISLNATTGELIPWRDHQSKAWITFSPQGYILRCGRGLIVPNGRGMPLTLDTQGANTVYRMISKSSNRNSGGDYATIVDKRIYIGTQNELCVFDTETGEVQTLWSAARMLVASGDSYFVFNMPALPGFLPAKGPVRPVGISAIDRAAADKAPNVDPTAMNAPVRWRVERPDVASIILAGDRLIAGCKDEVVMYDAASGAEVWKEKVDGVAAGLTFANGRLLVSTTSGAIHCFAKSTGKKVAVATTIPANASPGSVRRIAQGALRESGVKKGFALVIGEGAAFIAMELARQSELNITCIEPDENKRLTWREHVSAAGLYGHRVTINAPIAASKDGPARLPFPEFGANLIVQLDAEAANVTSASELARVLKPCGGVLLTALPPDSAALDAYKAAAMSQSAAVIEGEKPLVKFTRGELEGSGWWTHVYGDAGNSGSSGDRRVNGKLEVLWFGEPGPAEAPERHQRAMSPLVLNGRVFVQGWRYSDRKNTIICFDAYNGTCYWEREIPGAVRLSFPAVSGNLAAAGDSVFVVADSHCHRLDAATGEVKAVYETPDAPGGDGKKPFWSYLAVVDGILVGSTTPLAYKPDFYESRRNKYYGDENDGSRFSDTIFAIDLATGKQLWAHRASEVRDTTIVISGSRVFMTDNRGAPTTRPAPEKKAKAAVVKEVDESSHVPYGAEGEGASVAVDRLGQPVKETPLAPLLRTVLALELSTGNRVWEKEVDLAGCGRWDAAPPQQATGFAEMQTLCKGGVLMFAGAYHQHDGVAPGEKERRRAMALSMSDGSVIWSKSMGNLNRPIILGQTFLAGNMLRDLQTGEPLQKPDAKTGAMTPWPVIHGHACGTPSACDSIVFYRGGWRNILDGTPDTLMGTRAGCFINIIPAGGVVVQPEASSGCTCSYGNLYLVQCSLAFRPTGIANKPATKR